MIIPQANRLEHVQEYYFSRKLQQIRDMIGLGIDVLNLGIGSPDLAPSDQTITALQEAVAQPANHAYQSYRGIPELRVAIAKWYQRQYGVALDEFSEILPLIGSKEGIMHISMAFVNAGDRVLVPDPGYPTYGAVSRIVGANVEYYDMQEKNGWEINIDQLSAMDLDTVKIVWVNFPHMPTGNPGSPVVFDELIRLAKQHNFLIVNDNPYSMILNPDPQSLLSRPGAKDVVVELNSLSKSHNMAGWRIGWMAGHENYINAVLKVKSNIDSGMFKATQLAAAEALGNPESWHQELNGAYERRRKVTLELLQSLGCDPAPDQVGLFIWARIPDGYADSESFVEELLQRAHIFISPGFIFGKNGANYVRISLCNKEQIVKEAIQRVKKHRFQPIVES